MEVFGLGLMLFLLLIGATDYLEWRTFNEGSSLHGMYD